MPIFAVAYGYRIDVEEKLLIAEIGEAYVSVRTQDQTAYSLRDLIESSNELLVKVASYQYRT